MVDDGRTTDDGWTPDHGHPISSPCEPNGSGELIRKLGIPQFFYMGSKGVYIARTYFPGDLFRFA